MQIAICKAYSQEFWSECDDVRVGDTVFVQYAKDKKAAADVLAVGEYADDDKVLQMLLKGKQKKTILGKITMLGGAKDEQGN